MRNREIETLTEFDRAAASNSSMSGWQVQGLDLTGRDAVLRSHHAQGALFLGCTMSEESADLLREQGALLFPAVPDVPFSPYRGHLYTPTELYAGLEDGYAQTPDATIYAWAKAAGAHPGLQDLLAQALHDSSIDDALAEFVRGRQVVGVMGGHALRRDTKDYAAAARLGRQLARTGLTVATGGGPGAMEAANLGARVADEDEHDLDLALSALAHVEDFAPDVTAWAATAFAAVAGLTNSGRSMGIPTWFYGHEPPNPFASVIAKYFRNAIREDILLQVCRAGIVFLPGAAGTVQEVFQTACANYYADADQVAPMVLVGRDYWTNQVAAWQLLDGLARDRPMERVVHLVDDTSEVLAVLGR